MTGTSERLRNNLGFKNRKAKFPAEQEPRPSNKIWLQEMSSQKDLRVLPKKQNFPTRTSWEAIHDFSENSARSPEFGVPQFYVMTDKAEQKYLNNVGISESQLRDGVLEFSIRYGNRSMNQRLTLGRLMNFLEQRFV